MRLTYKLQEINSNVFISIIIWFSAERNDPSSLEVKI